MIRQFTELELDPSERKDFVDALRSLGLFKRRYCKMVLCRLDGALRREDTPRDADYYSQVTKTCPLLLCGVLNVDLYTV